MKSILTTAIALLWLVGPAGAQDDPPPYAQARQWAMQQTAEARKKHADAEHILVKPGVVADRKAKKLTIFAASTGLTTDDIVEFHAIQAGGPKAYEALAIAFATPSDIREAMGFVGLEAGATVNYEKLRFWPKGERIAMHFAPADQKPVRVEQLILDKQTGKPMAEQGLVYTGSYWLEDDQGKRQLAADVSEAQSIGSTYNAKDTLFDVPFQAFQGAVYGRFIPNPDRLLKAWAPLTITIQPLGKDRVVELKWMAKAGDPPKFGLTDADGKAVLDDAGIEAVLAKFEALGKAGKDVHVTLEPGPGVTLAKLRDVAKLVGEIDTEKGVRVGPPPAGHLYYRAFAPDPKWRQRDGRLFHGWEIHLTGTGEKATAKLLGTDDERTDDGQWIIRETPHDVSDPADIATVVKKIDTRGPRDLFVYAPATMTYRTLLRWIGPAMKSHPTVHVFIDE